MERTPVKSSQIKSIGHNPATCTLEVEFSNGAVYQYHGVEADAHADMMASNSIGAHFHQHIKNKHVTEKISGD